jgi:hypothetical protein
VQEAAGTRQGGYGRLTIRASHDISADCTGNLFLLPLQVLDMVPT